VKNVLFFDIETRVIPELSDQAKEWADDRTKRYDTAVALKAAEFDKQSATLAGTTPEWIEVVGISVAFNDKPPRSAWVGEPDGDGELYTEERLLESFWEMNTKSPILVSFNGSGFDIPVILHRSAMLGVMPTRNLYDIKPWDTETHIDVMYQRWPKMHRGRMGLKELGKTLKLPLPVWAHMLDTDGGEVGGMYLAALDSGDFTQPKSYGMMDIYLTRELARLWGGYFMPQLLPTWENLGFSYDYRIGQWIDGCPPEMA